MALARSRRKTTSTPAAFRLSPVVLKAAAKKAAKLGISRNKYVDQVLRKDLGLEGVDLAALERTSVFG